MGCRHVLINPCPACESFIERSKQPAETSCDHLHPKNKKKPREDSGEKQVSKATLKLRLLKRLKCTLKYEKQAWDCGREAGGRRG